MATSKKRKTSSYKWSPERRKRFEAKKYTQEREDDLYGMFNRPDMVNHPPHYNTHPAGIECIDVVEWLPFNVGNAIKYLWRAPHKSKGTSTSTELQDLKKAIWYIQREIERRTKELTSGPR